MQTVKITTARNRKIEATILFPGRGRPPYPAALFLHGWGSNREKHVYPGERLAAELGFMSLLVDLRGHGRTERLEKKITARDNLQDAFAAYDFLASRPEVDENRILVAGYSYGGFLAILVAADRNARWLAVRSPALYRDKDLDIPKAEIQRRGLMAFRRRKLSATDSVGLLAAATFEADLLVIEAEYDRIIPRQQVRNYLNAFRRAKSITHRIIRGADHAMSQEQWYRSAIETLVQWLKAK